MPPKHTLAEDIVDTSPEHLLKRFGNEISMIKGVHISGRPMDSYYDVHCLGRTGDIASITKSTSDNIPVDNRSEQNYRLMVPSLCHPHVHLDKCFLLSHPKYADLEIQEGDFSEALKLTSLSPLTCSSKHQISLDTISLFLYILRSRCI